MARWLGLLMAAWIGAAGPGWAQDAGRVQVWRAAESGAQPGPPSVFASGLEEPFGIAFWPPVRPRSIYVTETNRVVRYPYDGGVRPLGPAQVIIPSLPAGGHSTRDLAVAADGTRIFLSVGSASNVAEGMRGFLHRHAVSGRIPW